MSDDRLHRGQPDRSKINLSEDYEVKYWSRHFGISRETLAAVIEKVGNSAAAVEKELAGSERLRELTNGKGGGNGTLR